VEIVGHQMPIRSEKADAEGKKKIGELLNISHNSHG